MYAAIADSIRMDIIGKSLTPLRQKLVEPLNTYIQQKIQRKEVVAIQFICTHNSRRSHLAQIWAQIAAHYYDIPYAHCYSGGTEETALFPQVIETLNKQGLVILKLSESSNPVYAIKFSDTASPIMAFSKKHDHPFNPSSGFAAVLTCSQADEGCPFIPGAEQRIPMTYDDPKLSDNSDEQAQVYTERSLEIAKEMFYIFSRIKL